MKKSMVLFTTFMILLMTACDFSMPISYNTELPDKRLVGIWKASKGEIDTYEVLPSGKVNVGGSEFDAYYTSITDIKGKINFVSVKIDDRYTLLKYQIISNNEIITELVDPDFFIKYRTGGTGFKSDTEFRTFVKENMRYPNFYKPNSESRMNKTSSGNSQGSPSYNQQDIAKKKGGVNYEKAKEIFMSEENDELALQYINNGIRYDNQYASMPGDYHNLKCNILNFLGRKDECYSEAVKAISYDKTLVRANFYIGSHYQDEKDYNRALQYYNTAVNNCQKSDGEVCNAMVAEMGSILIEQKRYNEAISLFTQAIKGWSYDNDPLLSMIHSNRGVAFWRSGDKVKAYQDTNFALKLDSSNEIARYNLRDYNQRNILSLVNAFFSSSSSPSYQPERQPVDWDKNGFPIYGPSIREGGYDQNGNKRW